MVWRGSCVASALVVLAIVSASRADAAPLTFDERVRAREAIERVYFAHRIGAELPFDQAVPRSAIEATPVGRPSKCA